MEDGLILLTLIKLSPVSHGTKSLLGKEQRVSSALGSLLVPADGFLSAEHVDYATNTTNSAVRG